VVKLRDTESGTTLALDATGSGGPVEWSQFGLEEVFEVNKDRFIKYQDIDENFRTALNSSGVTPAQLMDKILSADADLQHTLSRYLDIPSFAPGGSVKSHSSFLRTDPTTRQTYVIGSEAPAELIAREASVNAALGGNGDFIVNGKISGTTRFFDIEKKELSGSPPTVDGIYYTTKIRPEEFASYFTEMREGTNRVMFMYSLLQTRQAQQFTIIADIFADDEDAVKDRNKKVKEFDRGTKKLFSSVHKFYQQLNQGVQQVMDELLNFVRGANQAQFSMLRMRVEFFGQENPAAGIATEMVNEATGAFEYVRAMLLYQVSRDEFDIAQYNAQQVAKQSEIIGGGIQLLYSHLPRSLGEREQDYKPWISKRIYQSAYDMMVKGTGKRAISQQFLKNTQSELSTLSTIMLDRGSGSLYDGGKHDYEAINLDSGKLGTFKPGDYTTLGGLFQLSANETPHNKLGVLGTGVYLDLNVEKGLLHRSMLTSLNNFVALVVSFQQNRAAMMRDIVASWNGKAISTAGTTMMASGIQDEIMVETNKQSTLVDNLSAGIHQVAMSTNNLVKSRIDMYKASVHVITKPAKFALDIAIAVVAPLLAASTLGIFSFIKPLFDAIATGANTVASSIVKFVFSLGDMGLEVDTPGFSRPVLLQNNSLFTDQLNTASMLGSQAGRTVLPDYSENIYSNDNIKKMGAFITKQFYDARAQVAQMDNSWKPSFYDDRGDQMYSMNGFKTAAIESASKKAQQIYQVWLMVFKTTAHVLREIAVSWGGGEKLSSGLEDLDALGDAMVSNELNILGAYKQEIQDSFDAANLSVNKEHAMADAYANMAADALDVAAGFLGFIPVAGQPLLAGVSIVSEAAKTNLRNAGVYGPWNAKYQDRHLSGTVDNQFSELGLLDYFSKANPDELKVDGLADVSRVLDIVRTRGDLKVPVPTNIPASESARAMSIAVGAWADEKERSLLYNTYKYGLLTDAGHGERDGTRGGIRSTSDDDAAAALGGDFREVNYGTFIQLNKELMGIANVRMILGMIQQSTFDVLASIVDNLNPGSGTVSKAGTQFLVAMSDRLNEYQQTMVQDFQKEYKSRVESYNAHYASGISIVAENIGMAAYIAAFILVPGTNAEGTKKKDDVSSVIGRLKLMMTKSRVAGFAKSLTSASVRLIAGFVGLSTLRPVPMINSNLLGGADAEKDQKELDNIDQAIGKINADTGMSEAEKKQKISNLKGKRFQTKLRIAARKQAKKMQDTLNKDTGGIQVMGAGKAVVNKASYSYQKAQYTRQMRGMKLLSEISLGMTEQIQSVAEDINPGGFVKSTVNLRKILGTIEKQGKQMVDDAQSAAESKAESMTRSIEMIKQGLTPFLSFLLEIMVFDLAKAKADREKDKSKKAGAEGATQNANSSQSVAANRENKSVKSRAILATSKFLAFFNNSKQQLSAIIGHFAAIGIAQGSLQAMDYSDTEVGGFGDLPGVGGGEIDLHSDIPDSSPFAGMMGGGGLDTLENSNMNMSVAQANAEAQTQVLKSTRESYAFVAKQMNSMILGAMKSSANEKMLAKAQKDAETAKANLVLAGFPVDRLPEFMAKKMTNKEILDAVYNQDGTPKEYSGGGKDAPPAQPGSPADKAAPSPGAPVGPVDAATLGKELTNFKKADVQIKYVEGIKGSSGKPEDEEAEKEKSRRMAAGLDPSKPAAPMEASGSAARTAYKDEDTMSLDGAHVDPETPRVAMGNQRERAAELLEQINFQRSASAVRFLGGMSNLGDNIIKGAKVLAAATVVLPAMALVANYALGVGLSAGWLAASIGVSALTTLGLGIAGATNWAYHGIRSLFGGKKSDAPESTAAPGSDSAAATNTPDPSTPFYKTAWKMIGESLQNTGRSAVRLGLELVPIPERALGGTKKDGEVSDTGKTGFMAWFKDSKNPFAHSGYGASQARYREALSIFQVFNRKSKDAGPSSAGSASAPAVAPGKIPVADAQPAAPVTGSHVDDDAVSLAGDHAHQDDDTKSLAGNDLEAQLPAAPVMAAPVASANPANPATPTSNPDPVPYSPPASPVVDRLLQGIPTSDPGVKPKKNELSLEGKDEVRNKLLMMMDKLNAEDRKRLEDEYTEKLDQNSAKNMEKRLLERMIKAAEQATEPVAISAGAQKALNLIKSFDEESFFNKKANVLLNMSNEALTQAMYESGTWGARGEHRDASSYTGSLIQLLANATPSENENETGRLKGAASPGYNDLALSFKERAEAAQTAATHKTGSQEEADFWASMSQGMTRFISEIQYSSSNIFSITSLGKAAGLNDDDIALLRTKPSSKGGRALFDINKDGDTGFFKQEKGNMDDNSRKESIYSMSDTTLISRIQKLYGFDEDKAVRLAAVMRGAAPSTVSSTKMMVEARNALLKIQSDMATYMQKLVTQEAGIRGQSQLAGEVGKVEGDASQLTAGLNSKSTEDLKDIAAKMETVKVRMTSMHNFMDRFERGVTSLLEVQKMARHSAPGAVFSDDIQATLKSIDRDNPEDGMRARVILEDAGVLTKGGNVKSEFLATEEGITAKLPKGTPNEIGRQIFMALGELKYQDVSSAEDMNKLVESKLALLFDKDKAKVNFNTTDNRDAITGYLVTQSTARQAKADEVIGLMEAKWGGNLTQNAELRKDVLKLLSGEYNNTDGMNQTRLKGTYTIDSVQAQLKKALDDANTFYDPNTDAKGTTVLLQEMSNSLETLKLSETQAQESMMTSIKTGQVQLGFKEEGARQELSGSWGGFTSTVASLAMSPVYFLNWATNGLGSSSRKHKVEDALDMAAGKVSDATNWGVNKLGNAVGVRARVQLKKLLAAERETEFGIDSGVTGQRYVTHLQTNIAMDPNRFRGMSEATEMIQPMYEAAQTWMAASKALIGKDADQSAHLLKMREAEQQVGQFMTKATDEIAADIQNGLFSQAADRFLSLMLAQTGGFGNEVRDTIFAMGAMMLRNMAATTLNQSDKSVADPFEAFMRALQGASSRNPSEAKDFMAHMINMASSKISFFTTDVDSADTAGLGFSPDIMRVNKFVNKDFLTNVYFGHMMNPEAMDLELPRDIKTNIYKLAFLETRDMPAADDLMDATAARFRERMLGSSTLGFFMGDMKPQEFRQFAQSFTDIEQQVMVTALAARTEGGATAGGPVNAYENMHKKLMEEANNKDLSPKLRSKYRRAAELDTEGIWTRAGINRGAYESDVEVGSNLDMQRRRQAAGALARLQAFRGNREETQKNALGMVELDHDYAIGATRTASSSNQLNKRLATLENLKVTANKMDPFPAIEDELRRPEYSTMTDDGKVRFAPGLGAHLMESVDAFATAATDALTVSGGAQAGVLNFAAFLASGVHTDDFNADEIKGFLRSFGERLHARMDVSVYADLLQSTAARNTAVQGVQDASVVNALKAMSSADLQTVAHAPSLDDLRTQSAFTAFELGLRDAKDVNSIDALEAKRYAQRRNIEDIVTRLERLEPQAGIMHAGNTDASLMSLMTSEEGIKRLAEVGVAGRAIGVNDAVMDRFYKLVDRQMKDQPGLRTEFERAVAEQVAAVATRYGTATDGAKSLYEGVSKVMKDANFTTYAAITGAAQFQRTPQEASERWGTLKPLDSANYARAQFADWATTNPEYAVAFVQDVYTVSPALGLSMFRRLDMLTPQKLNTEQQISLERLHNLVAEKVAKTAGDARGFWTTARTELDRFVPASLQSSRKLEWEGGNVTQQRKVVAGILAQDERFAMRDRSSTKSHNMVTASELIKSNLEGLLAEPVAAKKQGVMDAIRKELSASLKGKVLVDTMNDVATHYDTAEARNPSSTLADLTKVITASLKAAGVSTKVSDAALKNMEVAQRPMTPQEMQAFIADIQLDARNNDDVKLINQLMHLVGGAPIPSPTAALRTAAALEPNADASSILDSFGPPSDVGSLDGFSVGSPTTFKAGSPSQNFVDAYTAATKTSSPDVLAALAQDFSYLLPSEQRRVLDHLAPIIDQESSTAKPIIEKMLAHVKTDLNATELVRMGVDPDAAPGVLKALQDKALVGTDSADGGRVRKSTTDAAVAEVLEAAGVPEAKQPQISHAITELRHRNNRVVSQVIDAMSGVDPSQAGLMSTKRILESTREEQKDTLFSPFRRMAHTMRDQAKQNADPIYWDRTIPPWAETHVQMGQMVEDSRSQFTAILGRDTADKFFTPQRGFAGFGQRAGDAGESLYNMKQLFDATITELEAKKGHAREVRQLRQASEAISCTLLHQQLVGVLKDVPDQSSFKATVFGRGSSSDKPTTPLGFVKDLVLSDSAARTRLLDMANSMQRDAKLAFLFDINAAESGGARHTQLEIEQFNQFAAHPSLPAEILSRQPMRRLEMLDTLNEQHGPDFVKAVVANMKGLVGAPDPATGKAKTEAESWREIFVHLEHIGVLPQQDTLTVETANALRQQLTPAVSTLPLPGATQPVPSFVERKEALEAYLSNIQGPSANSLSAFTELFLRSAQSGKTDAGVPVDLNAAQTQVRTFFSNPDIPDSEKVTFLGNVLHQPAARLAIQRANADSNGVLFEQMVDVVNREFAAKGASPTLDNVAVVLGDRHFIKFNATQFMGNDDVHPYLLYQFAAQNTGKIGLMSDAQLEMLYQEASKPGRADSNGVKNAIMGDARFTMPIVNDLIVGGTLNPDIVARLKFVASSRPELVIRLLEKAFQAMPADAEKASKVVIVLIQTALSPEFMGFGAKYPMWPASIRDILSGVKAMDTKAQPGMPLAEPMLKQLSVERSGFQMHQVDLAPLFEGQPQPQATKMSTDVWTALKTQGYLGADKYVVSAKMNTFDAKFVVPTSVADVVDATAFTAKLKAILEDKKATQGDITPLAKAMITQVFDGLGAAPVTPPSYAQSQRLAQNKAPGKLPATAINDLEPSQHAEISDTLKALAQRVDPLYDVEIPTAKMTKAQRQGLAAREADKAAKRAGYLADLLTEGPAGFDTKLAYLQSLATTVQDAQNLYLIKDGMYRDLLARTPQGKDLTKAAISAHLKLMVERKDYLNDSQRADILQAVVKGSYRDADSYKKIVDAIETQYPISGANAIQNSETQWVLLRSLMTNATREGLTYVFDSKLAKTVGGSVTNITDLRSDLPIHHNEYLERETKRERDRVKELQAEITALRRNLDYLKGDTARTAKTTEIAAVRVRLEAAETAVRTKEAEVKETSLYQEAFAKYDLAFNIVDHLVKLRFSAASELGKRVEILVSHFPRIAIDLTESEWGGADMFLKESTTKNYVAKNSGEPAKPDHGDPGWGTRFAWRCLANWMGTATPTQIREFYMEKLMTQDMDYAINVEMRQGLRQARDNGLRFLIETMQWRIQQEKDMKGGVADQFKDYFMNLDSSFAHDHVSTVFRDITPGGHFKKEVDDEVGSTKALTRALLAEGYIKQDQAGHVYTTDKFVQGENTFFSTESWKAFLKAYPKCDVKGYPGTVGDNMPARIQERLNKRLKSLIPEAMVGGIKADGTCNRESVFSGLARAGLVELHDNGNYYPTAKFNPHESIQGQLAPTEYQNLLKDLKLDRADSYVQREADKLSSTQFETYVAFDSAVPQTKMQAKAELLKEAGLVKLNAAGTHYVGVPGAQFPNPIPPALQAKIDQFNQDAQPPITAEDWLKAAYSQVPKLAAYTTGMDATRLALESAGVLVKGADNKFYPVEDAPALTTAQLSTIANSVSKTDPDYMAWVDSKTSALRYGLWHRPHVRRLAYAVPRWISQVMVSGASDLTDFAYNRADVTEDKQLWNQAMTGDMAPLREWFMEYSGVRTSLLPVDQPFPGPVLFRSMITLLPPDKLTDFLLKGSTHYQRYFIFNLFHPEREVNRATLLGHGRHSEAQANGILENLTQRLTNPANTPQERRQIQQTLVFMHNQDPAIFRHYFIGLTPYYRNQLIQAMGEMGLRLDSQYVIRDKNGTDVIEPLTTATRGTYEQLKEYFNPLSKEILSKFVEDPRLGEHPDAFAKVFLEEVKAGKYSFMELVCAMKEAHKLDMVSSNTRDKAPMSHFINGLKKLAEAEAAKYGRSFTIADLIADPDQGYAGSRTQNPEVSLRMAFTVLNERQESKKRTQEYALPDMTMEKLEQLLPLQVGANRFDAPAPGPVPVAKSSIGVNIDSDRVSLSDVDFEIDSPPADRDSRTLPRTRSSSVDSLSADQFVQRDVEAAMGQDQIDAQMEARRREREDLRFRPINDIYDPFEPMPSAMANLVQDDSEGAYGWRPTKSSTARGGTRINYPEALTDPNVDPEWRNFDDI